MWLMPATNLQHSPKNHSALIYIRYINRNENKVPGTIHKLQK